MRKIEKIALKPSEIAAYYWINTIKAKLNELESEKPELGYNEKVFYNLFCYYKDADWRNVYTFLVNNLERKYKEDCQNKKVSSLKTGKGKHTEVIRALEMARDTSVPDIPMHNYEGFEEKISILPTLSVEVKKADGTIETLPVEYDPTYIIDGDKERLDFYNLLVTTIYAIQHKDKDFDSVLLLKERFCKKYIEDYNVSKDDIETVYEYFDYYMELIKSRDLLSSNGYPILLKNNMRQKDLKGLDEYWRRAIDYSNVITSPTEPENPRKKIKTRKEQ